MTVLYNITLLFLSMLLLSSPAALEMHPSLYSSEFAIKAIFWTALLLLFILLKLNLIIFTSEAEALYEQIGQDGEEGEGIIFKERVYNKILRLVSSIKTSYKRHSEEEKKEEALSRELYVHSLTGVSNQRALDELLKEPAARTVYIVKINDYLSIGELYGDQIAQMAIKSLAMRFNSFVERREFLLFQILIDEFVFYAEGDSPLSSAQSVVFELLKLVRREPLKVESVVLHPDVTIGVSTGTHESLERADRALRSAQKRREAFFMYKDILPVTKEQEVHISWNRALSDAVEKNLFELHYQPIVNQESKIVAYEALLRLNHLAKIVYPDKFLKMAKKFGFYRKLTIFAISEALKEFSNREDTVSINIDAEDILDVNISRYILEEIGRFENPDRVIFEIGDYEQIKDAPEAVNFFKKLREQGAKIAIDDFGKSTYGFESILKLKPDFIKIDGGLISKIDRDAMRRIQVKHIVAFAQQLGIKTIGKGIDSQEVLQTAKMVGINQLQGYYLYNPKKEIVAH